MFINTFRIKVFSILIDIILAEDLVFQWVFEKIIITDNSVEGL